MSNEHSWTSSAHTDAHAFSIVARQPVSQALLDEVYAACKQAYEKQGATKRLVLRAE